MKDINFNKLTKQVPQNIPNISAYENTKAVYEGYVKKIEKTDFANSISRYEIELNMLKSMKNMAEKYNNSKELKYIEEKIYNAKNNLEKLGIKIKDF